MIWLSVCDHSPGQSEQMRYGRSHWAMPKYFITFKDPYLLALLWKGFQRGYFIGFGIKTQWQLTMHLNLVFINLEIFLLLKAMQWEYHHLSRQTLTTLQYNCKLQIYKLLCQILFHSVLYDLFVSVCVCYFFRANFVANDCRKEGLLVMHDRQMDWYGAFPQSYIISKVLCKYNLHTIKIFTDKLNGLTVICWINVLRRILNAPKGFVSLIFYSIVLVQYIWLSCCILHTCERLEVLFGYLILNSSCEVYV